MSKKQLQQQRSRLLKERDGIVKAAVALPKTRQKIGITLEHCARRGKFTKVQDMPAQYRWDG